MRCVNESVGAGEEQILEVKSSRSQNNTQNRGLEREEYLLFCHWIGEQEIPLAGVAPSESRWYLDEPLLQLMGTLSV